MPAARIMVVDDERIVARDIERYLKELGHQVVAVLDQAEDAVIAAEKHRPDLVFMDIRLKGEMDGIEAATKIYQNWRIPAVFLTAYSDETTIDRAKKAEPYGYLLKPFEKHEIRTVVDIALFKHQADKRIRESEHQLRYVLDTIPALVWISNRSHTNFFFNRTWLDYTGKSLEEQNKGGWLELVHPEERDQVRLSRNRAMTHAEPLHMEFRLRGRTGKYLWMYETAMPRMSTQGQYEGHIGCCVNIDERRKLSSQINYSRKMEAVGQLAGGVAHDFNNLLTVIISSCHLLMTTGTESKVNQEIIQDMLRSAERGSDLTRQLLAFGRKQVLQPRILDLNSTVSQMEMLLRRIIGSHIHLHIHLADSPLPIKADPGQLEHVMLNLVNNARDAMSQGGKLTISTRQEFLKEPLGTDWESFVPGMYHVLSISDSGVGMDKATLERIFEPFFTTKEVGKGTGLGLASAYGAVRQSGGQILVESQPGKGTNFTIYFPREELEVSTPVFEDSGPKMVLPHGTERILLTEDEGFLRSMVRTILQSCGYEIHEAGNGAEALELGNKLDRIDLLLTDVVMPEMNGPALAKALRLKFPTLKVIYVSGYATEETMDEKLIHSRDFHFLQKPFKPADLATLIRNVLDDKM